MISERADSCFNCDREKLASLISGQLICCGPRGCYAGRVESIVTYSYFGLHGPVNASSGVVNFRVKSGRSARSATEEPTLAPECADPKMCAALGELFR